jgi:hypothetical protein
VWVRATDIIGNQKVSSTFVTMDFTPPTILKKEDNETTNMVLNIPDPKGVFNYSSRYVLEDTTSLNT